MSVYQQILQIVTEFAFGSDTALTVSQSFAVEQMSLWLTLGCVVLPFVLVLWGLKKVLF